MPSRPATSAVEFADTETKIDEHVIWSHVDLTVNVGEFVAILGPNGAGKSTLLRAMLGLQPISAGSLTVLGEATGRKNTAIGYLPQRRSFDGSLPIRGTDIVRLGLDGNRWGWPLPFVSTLFKRSAELRKRAIVETAIDNVDAGQYANRPIGKTSGGEQQRLLIAQALVRNPQILLLDEPLDSLDIPNQLAIAALIQRIANEHAITVMMVAHDVNPILPYLDRVIYVAGGRVLSGAPVDIIRTDVLSELYGAPVEVLRTSEGRLVVTGAPDAIHTHPHVAR